MASVFCPETSTSYADFAAFESAEQGAADKTAQIDGKVAGGTIQGWTGTLTIEATSNPYDGTNSATCDGLTSQLVIRNDNVVLSELKPIFVSDNTALGTIRLGAFESVANIYLAGGCSNLGTASNSYAIETNNNSGALFFINKFIVEKSGAGVWFRGNATGSTVNHFTVVNSSAGQGFRGGLDNDSGAEIKNALVIADPTAGQNDFIGTSYAGTSDYLASGDTSASTFSSTTSYTGQTTAELVDISGGDFRTKSTSTLATGGAAGTWIGGILEAGGGGGLTVDNILNNQVITQPTLSTGSQVSTDNITNSQLISNADLSQGYVLTADGLLSQQSLSEPLLTQANVLSVQSLLNNQSITNVTLAVAGGLSVQSILNAQNFSEPALTQQNQLTVNNVLNNQTLSAAELIQGFLLSVNDISSGQELTSPLLDVDGSISVQSLVSYQTISEPTITQHIALITNNITQDQFISNVRLNEEDQTIGTVTAAFKDSGIDVKYGIASFTIKFKD